MVNADTDYILVGQIGSTYGIKGWLKLLSYTEVDTAILEYTPWYIEDLSGWKEIQVEDSKKHNNGIIVKLAGFNSPEQAKLLSGKKIVVLRSKLPTLSKNEYYWNDLKGLTVIDQDGKNLGKVIYLIETGSNDVLVVKGTKEHGIPYRLGDVIKHIDLEKGEIHVNWEVI